MRDEKLGTFSTKAVLVNHLWATVFWKYSPTFKTSVRISFYSNCNLGFPSKIQIKRLFLFFCDIKQWSKLVAVLDFEYCNFTTWSVTVKKTLHTNDELAFWPRSYFSTSCPKSANEIVKEKRCKKTKGRVSSSLDRKKRPRRRSSFQCYCLSFAYH